MRQGKRPFADVAIRCAEQVTSGEIAACWNIRASRTAFLEDADGAAADRQLHEARSAATVRLGNRVRTGERRYLDREATGRSAMAPIKAGNRRRWWIAEWLLEGEPRR